MPLDRTDPVWDEYLSTGEDPTGGALEEKARAATYDDGYRDGYECGYDDGDCNEGYGYSWISADMDQFYSIAYKKGFMDIEKDFPQEWRIISILTEYRLRKKHSKNLQI